MLCACVIVPQHKTANNGTSGDGGNADDNDRQVVTDEKLRYCTLGLLDQCPANEQCVARRRPSVVLRSRSGLCRCTPGFVRDPHTNLCVNGMH